MLQTGFVEDSPRQPEVFIQAALDALSAHIAILDADGFIIDVNRAWCQFANNNGLTHSEYCINVNYLELCDSAKGKDAREASLAAQGIRDVMACRIPEFILEYPCHSRFKNRWFVMHVTRFEWNDEPRFIVAHQNITELKRAQIELKESQKRIEAILNNISNGIITFDEQACIESVNPAGARIFGYVIEEMLGCELTMLLLPHDHSVGPKYLLEYLVTSKEHEMTGLRRDGTEFPMYFSVDRLFLNNRRIYTAIVQDVTERKRMEAEILENEKLNFALEKEREVHELKNRFITMMSHELRTPLASIQISSDMLKRYGAKAPPEEKALYFSNITTQIKHLTTLMRDVQVAGTQTSKNDELYLEMTDIAEFCHHIVREFEINYRQTHHIVFDAGNVQICTYLDQKMMRQMLSNLLNNAVKYSPDGGTIAVYVHHDGNDACIQVIDEGIGIPKEDQKHLFEPFHRARNVDGLPGTGLGLLITRQAIESHNGNIRIDSILDVGTTVTLCLPILLEK